MHRLVKVAGGGRVDRHERHVGQVGRGQPRPVGGGLRLGQRLRREVAWELQLVAQRGEVDPRRGHQFDRHGSVYH